MLVERADQRRDHVHQLHPLSLHVACEQVSCIGGQFEEPAVTQVSEMSRRIGHIASNDFLIRSTCSGLIDQTSRLVKNGSVTSLTDGSFSLEVTTVTNSFLQFQQCQRSWTSCALARSCHSRWTNPEPHRGHCGFEIDAMWNLLRFLCAACPFLVVSEMICIKIARFEG